MTTYLIIFLFAYAIFVTIIALIIAKRADKLLQEIQMLKAEKGKLSNALREKGIEVTQLMKQIKRLKESFHLPQG